MIKGVKRSPVTCYQCGKEFLKEDYEVRRTTKRTGKDRHFCSLKCSGRYATEIQYGEYVGFGFYVKEARKRSLKRGFEFNLDAEYLYNLFNNQGGRCVFTSISMKLNRGAATQKEKSLYYASLDRIDNNKGYIKGNVQFVCLGVNYLRNTFTVEQTKEFLERLKQ